MKYLLDSHILIWALFADEKLSRETCEIINDPKNEIYYSVASVWEIGIKHSKSQEHALAAEKLRRAENTPPHKDPFDKILIAQAKCEG